MKPLLILLICAASAIAGGPGSGRRCNPYGICKACKDCSACKYCSGKDNSATCSVCREKKEKARSVGGKR